MIFYIFIFFVIAVFNNWLVIWLFDIFFMSEIKKFVLRMSQSIKSYIYVFYHHSNSMHHFRTLSWWTSGSTASAFRRTRARTSSSAWSWNVSCFCGRKPFRWPPSLKWSEYRY